MTRRLLIGFFLFAVLLTGCKKAEDKPSESNSPVISATVTKPEKTSSESNNAENQIVTPTQADETSGQGNETENTGPGCTVVSALPTPVPEYLALFAPREDDWSRGPEDARVTFMEYSDFQCPYCDRFTSTIDQLEADYPDDIRHIFRHFPLASIHDKALLMAQASEAAGLQGKFWEMHDYLFGNRDTWISLSPEEAKTWLIDDVASELGLDANQFKDDLTSDKIVNIAQKAWEHGQKIGVPGTPFLVINNIPYQGPTDFGSLEAIIEVVKLEDRQFTKCPPITIDPLKQYIATVKTEKGDIVLELFPDVAPIAVNNFIFLARNGWYDDVTFHRVLPGFVAQTGDPTGTGLGGPGYAFVNEVSPDIKFDKAGMLAMANAGPDSNGSQFFITYDAAPNLDGGYTIFGEVVDGMDVLNNLTPRDPSQNNMLAPGDRIITITIDEK
ncbi:MAG TPA: thioredoxin domain-containing protein [Anaerolineae bacterium]|nr:thioredoxin domain-containing protein [Anaerolineae bacterium]